MTLYFIIGGLAAIALIGALGISGGISQREAPKAFVLAMVTAACWPSLIVLGLLWQHQPAREWITQFVLTGKVR